MAVLVAALVGCSERERANPFDPRNGSTHGSPIGFRIGMSVALKWWTFPACSSHNQAE